MNGHPHGEAFPTDTAMPEDVVGLILGSEKRCHSASTFVGVGYPLRAFRVRIAAWADCGCILCVCLTVFYANVTLLYSTHDHVGQGDSSKR